MSVDEAPAGEFVDERHCPTCGRWLVRVRADGTYDEASNVDRRFVFDVGSGERRIGTARCLRLSCRLKRLRGK